MDKKVKVLSGGKKTQKLRPNKQQNKEQVGDEKNARNKAKEARRTQAKLIQERGRLLTPLKRQNSELEDRIEAMERRRSEIEQAMADSNLYADIDTFLQLTDEYKTLNERLEAKYMEWETLQIQHLTD